MAPSVRGEASPWVPWRGDAGSSGGPEPLAVAQPRDVPGRIAAGLGHLPGLGQRPAWFPPGCSVAVPERPAEMQALPWVRRAGA